MLWNSKLHGRGLPELCCSAWASRPGLFWSNFAYWSQWLDIRIRYTWETNYKSVIWKNKTCSRSQLFAAIWNLIAHCTLCYPKSSTWNSFNRNFSCFLCKKIAQNENYFSHIRRSITRNTVTRRRREQEDQIIFLTGPSFSMWTAHWLTFLVLWLYQSITMTLLRKVVHSSLVKTGYINLKCTN